MEYTDKPIDICTIVYVMTKVNYRMSALEYEWHDAAQTSDEDSVAAQRAYSEVKAIFDELYDDIWRLAHDEKQKPLEEETDDVMVDIAE